MRCSEDGYILGNARIITPEEAFVGAVIVERDKIVDISRSQPRSYVDCDGDYLLPGLIDVHTDNFEKHALPRAGVVWDLVTAAASHDAAMVAAGTTTVFDSLLAGGAGSATRRDLLLPAVKALNECSDRGLLRADHLLHIRCDLVEKISISLVEQLLDEKNLRFVTFIDDQPDRDPERAALVHERRRGLPRGSLTGPILPTSEEDFEGAEDRRSHLVTECHRRKVPVANHDDTKAAHVHRAAELGMKICEFPITMEAAVAARQHGMTVICGAPNLVRGKSHTGNVAVSDLVRAGAIDILCSD
jgi:alpha-D-ribose 1-methylphosphonate 5-triphosphate diphosphatase